MATGNTVPMLDPKGNPGFVPHENVNDAVAEGGKVGFHVIAPDGTPGIVPAEKLHDALTAGGKLYQQPQDKTQFEKDREHNVALSTAGHFAKEVASVPLGMASAIGNVGNPGAAIQQAGDFAADDLSRKIAGRSGAYRAVAGVGSMVGVNARGMEDAAEVGDTGGVLGTALGDAGIAAAAPKLGEKLDAMAKVRAEGKTFDAPRAAEKITDAINPSAEARPKFRADMERQIKRVANHVERGEVPGVTLENMDRKGLLKAMRSTAEEHQQVYNEQLLEPIKDRVADNGKTFAENEERLRHLNKTTDYRPTTAAESEAQVARKAEAASLRKVQNEGMAKHLNLTADQVEQQRASGEQLRDMADKTEYAMDLEQYGHNAASRSSAVNVHASPHGAYATTGGRPGAAINRGINRVLGHPGDTAVRQVFGNLKVGSPNVPVPNVAAADRVNGEMGAADRARQANLTDAQKRANAQVVANKTILAKPGEGNYAYRVRDVGEQGVPMNNSHAHATMSADEAKGYVDSRGSTQGKPQEVVRINLDKLKPADYKKVGGPNGGNWVRFTKQIPESAIERTQGGARPAPGSTATVGEQVNAKRDAAVSRGLDGEKWPASYRNAPKNLDGKGGGGANYSAQQLADLKKKHNL